MLNYDNEYDDENFGPEWEAEWLKQVYEPKQIPDEEIT